MDGATQLPRLKPWASKGSSWQFLPRLKSWVSLPNGIMTGEIRNQDCAAGLVYVETGSVGLVVTSPPYWSCKDYEIDGQIGYGQTEEGYLLSMREILMQMHRVLGPGCRAAINIGDQYLRAADHGRYRVMPIPAHLTTMGIEVGFDYMGGIIWNKISTTRTTGGCSLMGSMYHPKDGHVTYEHEFILLFKKQGKAKRPSKKDLELSRLTKEERLSWFRGVWSDVRPVRQDEHPAAFPIEIPRRLIRMYSFHGETVLDPFMGSGSTAVAAKMEGRNWLGFEISPEFCALAERRLEETS